ncbi:MAG TPA: alpha-glucuronidase family glycosyl hydrolase, partial [Candidatus Paceibacterota bacterium]|nr:alpha-glucuronidase family glycosyl hydrolase [Candidatus Paceibacterota bacterium]
MKVTRREFMAMGLAGAAGLCVGGCATENLATETPAPLPDEDGYKLWLRYAAPGNAAKNYRKVVRQIQVDGTSATCGVIRDELRSATNAMLGGAVPLNENGLVDGAVIVGTPG